MLLFLLCSRKILQHQSALAVIPASEFPSLSSRLETGGLSIVRNPPVLPLLRSGFFLVERNTPSLYGPEGCTPPQLDRTFISTGTFHGSVRSSPSHANFSISRAVRQFPVDVALTIPTQSFFSGQVASFFAVLPAI